VVIQRPPGEAGLLHDLLGADPRVSASGKQLACRVDQGLGAGLTLGGLGAGARGFRRALVLAGSTLGLGGRATGFGAGGRAIGVGSVGGRAIGVGGRAIGVGGRAIGVGGRAIGDRGVHAGLARLDMRTACM
jgi:hypothetical protein